MGLTLSPFGEGYCRHCRFIIGLGPDGLLEEHRPGSSAKRQEIWSESPAPCPGWGTRPGRRVPKESRNAAFTTKAERRICATCSREVPVRPGLRPGELYLSEHMYGDEACPDSFLNLNR